MSSEEEERKVRAYALQHTQDLIDELIRQGLVIDTGRKRNGQIVYTLTDKGKKHCDENLFSN